MAATSAGRGPPWPSADYRGPGGGTQPRLRPDRRVAYPRLPDGSDAPPHRRAAPRGRARARRRAAAGRRPRAPRWPPRCASRGGGRARWRSTSTAGATIFASRADTARTPASVEKLYTTSAALTLYGVDGHLTTSALGDVGVDPGGVLIGNLYLRGGGDPNFGARQAGRARGRARARQRPARDHRARDRRRVGLRLPARRRRPRATGPRTRSGPLSALTFNRGRTGARRPYWQSPPLFAARASTRALQAPRRRDRRRRARRADPAGRAAAGRALLGDDGRARPPHQPAVGQLQRGDADQGARRRSSARAAPRARAPPWCAAP